MPCQRTHHSSVRRDAFPDDFPQALERFKEASGMTWDEIAWLLGTTAATLWRWRNAGGQAQHPLSHSPVRPGGRQGTRAPAADHQGHERARSRSGERSPG